MGLGKWDIEIRTEFALDNEVNSSLRSQLECWNNGIMGLGKWDIEIRTEFALDNEVNKRVSFLQYQHSNILLFHYSMYEA